MEVRRLFTIYRIVNTVDFGKLEIKPVIISVVGFVKGHFFFPFTITRVLFKTFLVATIILITYISNFSLSSGSGYFTCISSLSLAVAFSFRFRSTSASSCCICQVQGTSPSSLSLSLVVAFSFWFQSTSASSCCICSSTSSSASFLVWPNSFSICSLVGGCEQIGSS